MGKITPIVVAFLCIGGANAQSGSDVQTTGAELDARLFAAYNECDLSAFGALLAKDVEFYHDKGGLMTGRQSLVDAVQKNICGKVRREGVPGTLRSYSMDNYGLVQLGEHRFCSLATSKCEGIARFVHLWQRTGNSWQVTRIISYDHNPL